MEGIFREGRQGREETMSEQAMEELQRGRKWATELEVCVHRVGKQTHTESSTDIRETALDNRTEKDIYKEKSKTDEQRQDTCGWQQRGGELYSGASLGESSSVSSPNTEAEPSQSCWEAGEFLFPSFSESAFTAVAPLKLVRFVLWVETFDFIYLQSKTAI